MAEQPAPKTRERTGPYKYLVCRIEEGRLVPLLSSGEDAEPRELPLIVAKSPAKAREHVFAKLTERQPADQRDDFKIELLAIREENLGRQMMAWNVTREVAAARK